ncbi:hypothetical protein AHAS_Ahas17G0235100 [Arachis hypogaea]
MLPIPPVTLSAENCRSLPSFPAWLIARASCSPSLLSEVSSPVLHASLYMSDFALLTPRPAEYLDLLGSQLAIA